MKLFLLLVCLLQLAQVVVSVKVVGLPLPGMSHYKTFSMLGREMTKRGHQFTMFTFNKTSSWEGIETHTVPYVFPKDFLMSFKQMQSSGGNPIKSIMKMLDMFYNVFDVTEQLTYAIAQDREAVKVLEECDLIIGETSTFAPNLFSKYLNKPFVLFHPITVRSLITSFRLPVSLADVPGMNSLKSPPIPLPIQAVSYVMGNAINYLLQRHVKGIFNKLKARFNVTDIPMDTKAPLIITNYDPVLDYPVSLHPNMISTGVLTIQKAKPLSSKYTDFISKQANGFILVAFGTVFTLDTDAATTERNFIDDLAKHNFGFIISTKREHQNLPANILTDPYLPQNDLLAHPLIKLFISHVGSLSMSEACYHRVPVLAVPRALDQFDNAFRLANHVRMAKMFKFGEFDAISQAIPHMVNDDTLQENARRCGKKLGTKPIGYARGRMVDVIEELIAWNYNATHLQPAVHDRTLFEWHMFDIALTMFLVVLLPVFIYKFCKK